MGWVMARVRLRGRWKVVLYGMVAAAWTEACSSGEGVVEGNMLGSIRELGIWKVSRFEVGFGVGV